MKINLTETGRKLRKHRKMNEMSINEVATILNVNTENFYRWETGRNQPGMLSLYRMAQLYGVTMEDLLVVTEDEDDD